MVLVTGNGTGAGAGTGAGTGTGTEAVTATATARHGTAQPWLAARSARYHQASAIAG